MLNSRWTSRVLGICAAFSASAAAQNETLQPTPVEPAAIDAIERDMPIAMPVEPGEPTEVDEDAITRELNANTRLDRSFTLRRRVNGELVETTKRTVALPRGATDNDTAPSERALAAYDDEVLSRVEALEEAKNDFTAADTNKDGLMSKAEFEALAKTWRAKARREESAESQEHLAREERREAFLAELKRETDDTRPHTDAARKFAFLAGMSQTISREDYVREYMLDFDSVDENKDMILKGDELKQFRALNRGETTSM